jgi:hypothetical protein
LTAVCLFDEKYVLFFFLSVNTSWCLLVVQLADLHRQRVSSTDLQAAGAEGGDIVSFMPFISCPFKGFSTDPSLTTPSSKSTSTPSLHPSCSRTPSIGESWQTAPKIYRSKSVPKFDFAAFSHYGQGPPSPVQDDFFEKMPRRLKFFYFLARTRMFQRLIMVRFTVDKFRAFMLVCLKCL